MNELPLIKAVFRQVHQHFVWTSDQEVWSVPEHWTSYADEVERDEIFRDDCDAFAMTAVDILMRKGIEPENCYLATCWTETGEYHAVGIVHGWLLDNRMRTLRPWSSIPGYKWHTSMRLSEKGTWRETK